MRSGIFVCFFFHWYTFPVPRIVLAHIWCFINIYWISEWVAFNFIEFTFIIFYSYHSKPSKIQPKPTYHFFFKQHTAFSSSMNLYWMPYPKEDCVCMYVHTYVYMYIYKDQIRYSPCLFILSPLLGFLPWAQGFFLNINVSWAQFLTFYFLQHSVRLLL